LYDSRRALPAIAKIVALWGITGSSLRGPTVRKVGWVVFRRVWYHTGMETAQKRTRVQFRLRSVLMGMMWFALILAICVKHQTAATRHRQALESLRAAGMLPGRVFPAPARPTTMARPMPTASAERP
jgi:hypothetical protein